MAAVVVIAGLHFPSFSEGLSLRPAENVVQGAGGADFPSFSEGLSLRPGVYPTLTKFFLYFPSFSEGLSLRRNITTEKGEPSCISLPFRKGFH